MGVIKVKPWGDDQGDHVLIEEEDFDPDFHEAIEPEQGKRQRKAKPEAIEPEQGKTAGATE